MASIFKSTTDNSSVTAEISDKQVGERLKKMKSRWRRNVLKKFKKIEERSGSLILFFALHAPTPITGKMHAWTYSTGKRSFEDALLWISALIKKARGSGSQSVLMNFNDDFGEFMGCLKPELAHVIEDLTTELAMEDEEIRAIESNLAELCVKPMDEATRHAVEELARSEFKKALITVTAAWEEAEFILPEHQTQVDSNGPAASEDPEQASAE